MVDNTKEKTGKIQTVLGLIDSENIGITLPHEHIFLDMANLFSEPVNASEKGLAYEPIIMKNLSWLRHNQLSSRDNIRLLDEELAVQELMYFKQEGGKTIIELSNVNLLRDPLALARVSRITGLNIVMGSGYYIANSLSPDYASRTDEDIAEEIINDIEVGVRDTGIHAGIIGEIGCSWPLDEREKKTLHAAAIAQRRTGAAINAHSGSNAHSPMEIIEVLDKAGADISRVIISHIDSVDRPLDIRCELAKTGCYLSYDNFGSEVFVPVYAKTPPRCSDKDRIEQVIELIGKGYLKQLLLSHDICLKIRLIHYGGNGYAHILRNIVPRMLMYGVTREQINTLLVDNPKTITQLVTGKVN